MSRHEIVAGDIEVVVGWDPPLNTFFAQAWDRTKDEDDPNAELLWIGCGYREIADLDLIGKAVAPWVQLPDDVIRALYAEAHS